VRNGADAVTVYASDERADPNATSARNRLHAEVVAIESGETVSTVQIGVDGVTFRVLITSDSAARLDLAVGDEVLIRWKATATRLVSQTSGSGSR
ncbi:molybdopterin-binding protein, partial [Halorubrum pallidum]